MSSTATILRPFLLRQRGALAGAGAASLFVVLADLAKPWPIKLVIDHLFAGRKGEFELDATDVRILAAIAALVVVIAAVDALATYVSDLWLQRAGERINHELRVAVYAHLQRLSLAFHQRSQKGDLLTRVTGDVNAVGTLFADSLGPMVQAGLLLVGIAVVTLVLDPLLAAVSLLAMPPLAVLSFRYRRRVREAARRQRRQEGEIASIANEALSAMPVVKAFGSERYEHERVEQGSARRMDLGLDVARLEARFQGLIAVASAIGVALVVVVGVFRVSAGALTPGDLVVFAAYARKLNSPLRAISRGAVRVSRGMARADRIAELLAEDEMLEDRPGAHRGPRAAGAIALERVSFGYTPERRALDGVSLQIAAGSSVALVGPSGSGKSTLGALVARFFDPVEGRVLLDGRDLRDCSLAWLRDQVGVLLQDTVLFTGTVAENIAYATPASTREEIVAAARVAHAHEFIEALPRGYDTELGPQGVGLSGGQRQRIGIARTVLRDPAILLLDEPTTGLDAASEAQVLDGLFALMLGRTTVVITHSRELAARADRTVALQAGRVVPAPQRQQQRRGVELDEALPHMERMLDGDAMAPALERSLGGGRDVRDVHVQRVAYKPQDRLVVHYAARVDGERHDAVATTSSHINLRRRAERVAAGTDGRQRGRPPVYDPELNSLISWLPFDPNLPGMAVPADRLIGRLQEAGVDVPGEAGEPETLRYKPGTRAVLGLDAHILKAYGKDRQFAGALAGLKVSSDSWVPTAAFEAAFPDLRLTVQSRVAGRVPRLAADTAVLAGEFARRLQESSFPGLTAAPARHHLQQAGRVARLAVALQPDLAPRLAALLARLTRELPETTLRPAHGDFHSDQFLVAEGGELSIIDFDDLCAAPPAFDLATYAADVVKGRGRDVADVHAVLGPLLEGYGERPDGLAWYVSVVALSRCTHPFRTQADGWPERMAGMVRTAEEVLEA